MWRQFSLLFRALCNVDNINLLGMMRRLDRRNTLGMRPLVRVAA